MKLKDGIIITQVENEFILVAAGEAGRAFNGMIKMNETAGLITQCLINNTTIESVVEVVCKKYDVDIEVAKQSVECLVKTLRKSDLIE